jgi:hypothetical protein
MPDPARKLDNLISDIPTGLQRSARAGFALASSIPEDIRARVIELFVSSMARGLSASVDIEEIAKIAHLDNADAAELLLAVAAAFTILSQSETTPEEFAQRASGTLFAESEASTARSIAREMTKQRAGLPQIFRRGQLANATLPSMRGFHSSVDLRLGFKEDKLEAGVPVALIHISTDGTPEIWFQMTRGDVERMIKNLQRIEKRMEVAERVVRAEQIGSRTMSPDLSVITNVIVGIWAALSSQSAGLWLFAAIGTILSWTKMKKAERDVYGLTELIKRFVPDNEEKRGIVEIVVFVLIGCILAMGIIAPSTPPQALAVGLGWTALTTTPR